MTLDELLALVLDGRGRFDGDEEVDDLAHALQTAALAVDAGADADLVGAALLHDVGHHPVLTERFPLTPHEKVAAQLVTDVLGERAGWVVRQHVEAKRHLAATEPAYAASLSRSSADSLVRQGGAVVIPELLENPWGAAALDLRRWDDLAKLQDAPEPDWADLVALVRTAVI